MKSKNLEQRVSELESQVSELIRSLGTPANAKPWWERITGTFEKDPTYKKAMQLGKEYRESLRPAKRPKGKR